MKLDLRKNNCSLYVFVSKGLRLTRKTILKPKKRKLEIIKNRNRLIILEKVLSYTQLISDAPST